MPVQFDELAGSPLLVMDRRGGSAKRTFLIAWGDIDAFLATLFGFPVGGVFQDVSSVPGFPWLVADQVSVSPWDPDSPSGMGEVMNVYPGGAKIEASYKPLASLYGLASGPGLDHTGPGGSQGSTAGQGGILVSQTVRLSCDTLIVPTLGVRTALASPLALAIAASTSATGGTIPAGVYRVGMTEIVSGVETGLSPAATVTTAGATSTITVKSPVNPPAATTGYRVYIASTAGGPFWLQDNSSTGQPTTAIGTDFLLTTPPLTAGSTPPTNLYDPSADFGNPTFNVPATVKVSHMMPAISHDIYWTSCPWPPWTAARACAGKVNQFPFAGAPPGTAMFLGLEATRDYSIQAGANAWKVRFHFAEKNYGTATAPMGWNFWLFPDGSFQALCRAADGSPLYPLTDFSGLFQPGP